MSLQAQTACRNRRPILRTPLFKESAGLVLTLTLGAVALIPSIVGVIKPPYILKWTLPAMIRSYTGYPRFCLAIGRVGW